jgi:hypothetical protein
MGTGVKVGQAFFGIKDFEEIVLVQTDSAFCTLGVHRRIAVSLATAGDRMLGP